MAQINIITLENPLEIINEETHWSYPLDEIDYILEQIDGGDRGNGETFILYNGRLYETYETEVL